MARGERTFSEKQIAELWVTSVAQVWRLFQSQPDVVVAAHPAAPRKKKFMRLLIPENVVIRVYEQLTKNE